MKSRCAAYRFHIQDAIPFERALRVEIDHGYTNQVAADYSSVAYWYQTEPHAAFPLLPPPEGRLPTPAGENALQFALFTSPVWLPLGALAWRLLRKMTRSR